MLGALHGGDAVATGGDAPELIGRLNPAGPGVFRGAVEGFREGSWEGSRVGSLEGSRVGSQEVSRQGSWVQREGFLERSRDRTPNPTPGLAEMGPVGSGCAAGGPQARPPTEPQSGRGVGVCAGAGRGLPNGPVAEPALPERAVSEARGGGPAVGDPPGGAGSSAAAGLSVRVTDQFTCPITQVRTGWVSWRVCDFDIFL